MALHCDHSGRERRLHLVDLRMKVEGREDLVIRLADRFFRGGHHIEFIDRREEPDVHDVSMALDLNGQVALGNDVWEEVHRQWNDAVDFALWARELKVPIVT